LIFKEFDLNVHDVYKVAELTYDVDERTFSKIFNSKKEAIEAIKNRLIYEFDMKCEDDDYNSLFYVFFDDEDLKEEEIIGMFNGGKGVKHHYFREFVDCFKNLKFSQALALGKVTFLDSFVLADVEEDDFYIGELAISSDKRGKGYGKQALYKLLDLAKDMGCKRVVLDADFRNDGAFRLYKSIGFKVFDEKSFGVFGKKRGMRNMEYILKED